MNQIRLKQHVNWSKITSVQFGSSTSLISSNPELSNTSWHNLQTDEIFSVKNRRKGGKLSCTPSVILSVIIHEMPNTIHHSPLQTASRRTILEESVPGVVKGADFGNEKGHAISRIVGDGGIESDRQQEKQNSHEIGTQHSHCVAILEVCWARPPMAAARRRK